MHYTAIVVLGLIRLLVALTLRFRPFDDTYITFRYALTLASGHGFVYNAGEHVLGLMVVGVRHTQEEVQPSCLVAWTA